jgi:tRNA-dihydrouridine synthase B
MGCPVKKVVGGQDGCALMKNEQLAMDIVKSIKDAIDCPVTVKFRLGYTQDEMNYVEFGQKMQEAGADLITIHARTKKQMYSGIADWKKIKDLKTAVDIPVVANGDIKSVEDAIKCLEQSNADGVAIGRAAMGDVSLIHRIEHYLNSGEILPVPTFEENILNLKQLILEEINLRGEDIGVKFSRKFYPFYITGIRNAAKYRADIITEEDYKKIFKNLDNIICDMLHPSVF